jgi:hypothetical protein
VTSSRAEIVEAILRKLHPLRSDISSPGESPFIKAGCSIVEEIGGMLDLMRKSYSDLIPLAGMAKRQSGAARRLLLRLQKDRDADLLRAAAPNEIAALEDRLEWLSHIVGPGAKYGTAQAIAARFARSLLKRFSQSPATNAEDGPLRAVASLCFEYLTGKSGHELHRAVKTVLHEDKVESNPRRLKQVQAELNAANARLKQAREQRTRRTRSLRKIII